MRALTHSVAGVGLVVCLELMISACAQQVAAAGAGGVRAGDAPAVPAQSSAAGEPRSPSQVSTVEPDTECRTLGEPGDPVESVALSEPVDPANAPHPANDSERLLFRQVYETLVRIDCMGRVRPALAASWQADATGRVWTMTLRDARFSDGAPVRAADVVAWWTSGGADVRPRARGHVESVTAVAERTLAITVRAATGDAALIVLGHADLAIARRAQGSWPLGTRGVRIEPAGVPANARRETLAVVSVGAPSDGSVQAAPLRFLLRPNRDRRDSLDEGVDLLLTRDRATLDYAATLPHLRIVPLSWQRTHVFLSPWRGPSMPQPSLEARQTIAADAVRGDARGAEAPFWWHSLSQCPAAPPPPRALPPLGGGRLVYDRADDASRDLSERLVGLARASGRSSPAVLSALLPATALASLQSAVGLAASELGAARGNDVGYVVAFDRIALDPCHQWNELTTRFSWADPDAIVPLVDTRPHAIVRRGRSGATSEWDGALTLRHGR
jgi:hypothetical protein